MESAVLLRVPAALAEQLHKQLAGNHSSSKDKDKGDEKDGSAAAVSSSSSSGPSLKLSFLGPDGGVLLQQSHSAVLRGSLVNLPTLLEVHKTFDNIHYYKCADIGQMIVVQNAAQTTAGAAAAAAGAHAPSSLNANPARPKNANDPSAAAASAAAPPPIPVDYPHGLTPPTRDIRPKRFDRDTKVPSRIVTEVDSLMANIKDNKAVNYFELVEDEEEVGEEEEEEENMAEEEAEAEAEEEEERRQQQEEEEERQRRQRTDESAARGGSSTLQTPFQQQQKLLSTPAVHRGPTPDARTAGTPFLAAVSASPIRGSPLATSVFGASPAVHADTADMSDVSLDLFSSQNASSAAAAGTAGSSSAAPPAASPLSMIINVSGVENMFGASPTQAQQAAAQAGAQPMDLTSFLPETPHTPVQGAVTAGFAPAAAAAAAAAPPSASDLVRAELSDVQSRISIAEKEIAESKNMLLKRKAEQRLQALQEEKRGIEARL